MSTQVQVQKRRQSRKADRPDPPKVNSKTQSKIRLHYPPEE